MLVAADHKECFLLDNFQSTQLLVPSLAEIAEEF
jgi:hypothetical protein